MNHADDQKWRDMLKRYDLTTPLAAAELAVLEHRILAQIDALPDRAAVSGISLASLTFNGTWAVRGACLAAVLFVLLGFIVGRDFDDLSFGTADSGALFASADGTPWQSFITAPSSGETDDTSE
jgi:hypothetical protein